MVQALRFAFGFDLVPQPSLSCRVFSVALQTKAPIRFSTTACSPCYRRSPTHLVRFRRSRFAAHLTELQLRGLPLPEVRGRPAEMDTPSRMDKALAAAGNSLERGVLNRLSSLTGAVPYTVPRDRSDRYELTEQALMEGVPIIHQPALSDGCLLEGYADILLRNSHNPFAVGRGPSDAYCVIEVKLASKIKTDYALQATAYTNLVESLLKKLGMPAPGMPYLWLGNATSEPRPLEYVDIQPFYESVKASFQDFLASFDPTSQLPIIDGSLRDLAPWSTFAQQVIEESDSLLQIAGIRRAHVHALNTAGIQTMTNLAELSWQQAKKAAASVGRVPFDALRQQAILQVKTRNRRRDISAGDSCYQEGLSHSTTSYDVIPCASTAPAGLHRLPLKHPMDVFFDMEGYPLVDGGLEYLLGALDTEKQCFRAWWAHDRQQEEEQFVSLMGWLWHRHVNSNSSPVELRNAQSLANGMHIYHYGHYEVSALRRIAARAESAAGMEAGFLLEKLIDWGLFVDVYKIVKSNLRLGEPNYSIKSVEKVVGVSRAGAQLSDAESSVAMYHEWRCLFAENNNSSGLILQAEVDRGPLRDFASNRNGIDLLENIEIYNKQDCESLGGIVQWLRQLAEERGIEYCATSNYSSGDDAKSSSGDNFGNISSDSSDNVPTAEAVEGNAPPLAHGACGSTPAQKFADSANIDKAEKCSLNLLLAAEAQRNEQSAKLYATVAHLLQFHLREMSPSRAQFVERISRAASGDSVRLFYDDQAISLVRLEQYASGTLTEAQDGKKSSRPPRHKALYRFDRTEPIRWNSTGSWAFVQSPISSIEQPRTSDIYRFGRVRRVSNDLLEIEGKYAHVSDGKEPENPLAGSLISCDDLIICPASLRAAILQYGESLFQAVESEKQEQGSLGIEASKLVTNFLLRRSYLCENANRKPNYPASTELVDIVAKLKGDTFVIQGPPGTGKSTTSAQVIADLVLKHGKTVAISSNSHAAIDNLLRLVFMRGVPCDTIRKIGPLSEGLQKINICRTSNINSVKICPFNFGRESKSVVTATTAIAGTCGQDDAFKKPHGHQRKTAACVVGATAYALSNPRTQMKFDFIFVDEAGQVPLANFVAMAQSALAAVLVGDQQQLEMPLLGQHPDSVSLSCLSYFVGPKVAIVPASRGTFLNTSYRMPPRLCAFISKAVYNNFLAASPETSSHSLHQINGRREKSFLSDGLVRAKSLLFIDREKMKRSPGDFVDIRPGRHFCPKEAGIVQQLYRELLGATYSARGITSAICPSDILVIAPYNVQVAALKSNLPETARVGTIDKFQGQEAAVVLISTCVIPENEASAIGEDCFEDEHQKQVLDEPLRDNRGVEFALSENRLNVALSRAQVLAIVVGPTDIAISPFCRTLEQAKALSFYSKIVKEGSDICASRDEMKLRNDNHVF